MAPSEEMIEAAIQAFQAGEYPSQRATARAFGISPATFSARLRGRSTRQVSHEHTQRLSPAQEDFLAEWILEQDMQGYPPSHTRAREMAARIIRMNGDIKPLGKKWI